MRHFRSFFGFRLDLLQLGFHVSTAVSVKREARGEGALAVALHASRIPLPELRALLPAPLPQVPGMPTGVDLLDRALASGGLPRGRLTEVVGATGKLTFLRQVVAAAVKRGEWVAYIDASRTLAPRDWAHLGHDVVWIVRPPEATRAAWCADVLLRSAAFSLVVLDSAPPISRAVAVRLTGLARDSNAAFIVVGSSGATRLGGAVRLRMHRRRQRLRIAIEKGCRVQGAGYGEGKSSPNVVEVSCADGVARRLCTHPEVPDRRGAARASTGRPGKGRRAATPSYGGSSGMLQNC
jgi:hypothetical protein